MDDAWVVLQGAGVVLLVVVVGLIGMFASPGEDDDALFEDDAS